MTTEFNNAEAFIKVNDNHVEPQVKSKLVKNPTMTCKVTPRASNINENKLWQKNNIQFSKLPSHLQQKYVELFRPKELQELLTNSGSPN